MNESSRVGQLVKWRKEKDERERKKEGKKERKKEREKKLIYKIHE
jgi:hypothetical protein